MKIYEPMRYQMTITLISELNFAAFRHKGLQQTVCHHTFLYIS